MITNERRTIADVVCTHCGCLCDDVSLRLEPQGIAATERACPIGDAWLRSHQAPASDEMLECRIDGQPASRQAALDAAAGLLRAARHPLVYGLATTTCEAQRRAVGLADWLGATVDTTSSDYQGAPGTAFQGVGEVTGTFGEIRHRGDLVIFWRSNPVITHPRHLERYSLTSAGMFLPHGRGDRTCIVVDTPATETAALADEHVALRTGADFEALWVLRALVRGVPLEAEQVRADTGVELKVWQALAQRMRGARFGVLLFDRQPLDRGQRHLVGEAIAALVRDLNAHTRFIAVPMRGGGNLLGADNVLLWRTGYPFGVSFARGYPRSNPGETTAEALLSRREVDAAMLVAIDPSEHLSPAAWGHLQSVPCVAVGAVPIRWPDAAPARCVEFRTAVYGLHTPGTVYRSDDVPLPLRPTLSCPLPSDEEILQQLEARIHGG